MNRLVSFTIVFFLCYLFSTCTSKQGERANAEIIRNDSIQEYPKDYDSNIYVGSVLGTDADAYNKDKTFRRDTIYGLEPLTRSKHLVEIRFYLQSYWSDTTYATTLTYDTTFKMSRIKHFYSYDTVTHNSENRKSINLNIPVKTNPDSIFNKLIENGIFSLTEIDKKDYEKQEVKELTKHGLKNGTQIIGDILDATDFILEYKVDTIYNTIYMQSPYIYFQHNPDYQLFRRYYEITKLLLSGLE